MRDLIIAGASGFGREVAWLVERINEYVKTEEGKWNLLGFIDDDESKQGTTVNSYPVLGKVESIKDYSNVFVVCAIGSTRVRRIVVNKIKESKPDVKFATLIDPSVIMSRLVEIGEGSIICAGNIITVNISIGEHVIVNLDCTIGHDAVINDFVTMYPSANISGNVTIGEGAEIGTGMQVIQGMNIADNTIIGAGAVVVEHIDDKGTYVGVPARVMK